MQPGKKGYVVNQVLVNTDHPFARYQGLRRQARIWQRALSTWKPVTECPDHVSRAEWKRLGDAAWRKRAKIESKLKNGCYSYMWRWKEDRETARAERQQQMADAKSGREPATV